MACSTSAGTDTFSRMNVGTSMPYLPASAGLTSGSNASPNLAVARRHVEHRDAARRQRLAEHADDAGPHDLGEFLEPEVVVGPGDLSQELRRIDDAEVVGAEGAHPDDAQVLIPHHHGIGRAPLVAGEQARRQEVHVRLEGRLEPVLPPLQPRQHRNVGGRQRVPARREPIAELAEIDELHGLRLADDELRASLDLLVVVGEPVRQRVARIIRPLDDLDELAADEVGQAHGHTSL